MEINEILAWANGGLFLVIGYFLRGLIKEVKENTQENGKNKGRIELLQLQLTQEREMRETELKNQQQGTQAAIKHLTEQIGRLTEEVQIAFKSKLNEGD